MQMVTHGHLSSFSAPALAPPASPLAPPAPPLAPALAPPASPLAPALASPLAPPAPALAPPAPALAPALDWAFVPAPAPPLFPPPPPPPPQAPPLPLPLDSEFVAKTDPPLAPYLAPSLAPAYVPPMTTPLPPALRTITIVDVDSIPESLVNELHFRLLAETSAVFVSSKEYLVPFTAYSPLYETCVIPQVAAEHKLAFIVGLVHGTKAEFPPPNTALPRIAYVRFVTTIPEILLLGSRAMSFVGRSLVDVISPWTFLACASHPLANNS